MLTKLQKCKNKSDFACLLGISETHLNIVVFSKNHKNNYREFPVPKKSGGVRKILSPNPNLKKLQQKISDLLYECYEEIQKNRISNQIVSTKSFTSYGFQKKLTIKNQTYNLDIYNNAKKHVNKRLVLNIDLKDFFENITFSRIVGFFTKNNSFQLNKNIAILIAQIVTYRKSPSDEGFLPQGSPTSPVISNLIGGVLDRKILLLAKKYKLNYSRYVDDITLSTNLREFPKQIAEFKNNECELGNKLKKEIIKSGFTVNDSKTRLCDNSKRQVVTGLTVNNKVNINQDYYRYTRSMVHKFCTTGNFEKSKTHRNHEINSRNSLSGILNFIYNIKTYKQESIDDKLVPIEDIKGIEKLYLQFLFHHQFVFLKKTTIIGEGITDPRHLKIAYKQTANKSQDIVFKSMQGFKKFNQITKLGGGTGLLCKFLSAYYKQLFKADTKPNMPCIILVDGDKDGRKVVDTARSNYKSSFEMLKTSSSRIKLLESYFVFHNLYIITLPKDTYIEKLYLPEVLDIKLGGKNFNMTNKKNENSEYGKKVFIEKVVEPRKSNIDFSGFEVIFDTISFIKNDLTRRYE